MKQFIVYIILIVCCANQLFSQEDGVIALDLPLRNSLRFNRYAINPTFSFVREQNKFISFSNKRQWVQFDDAPTTYLFSYSGRFSENIGAGLGLFQQNYGVLTTFGGVANFAYNVVFNRDSHLTFGTNLGFYSSGINNGRVVTNFQDPSLDNILSNSVITINPGINYGVSFFDFGLSVNNLIAYNLTTSEMLKDNPEQAFQAHVMYTGYMNSGGFFDQTKFSTLISSEFKTDQTVLSGIVMLTVPKGFWGQAGYNTMYGLSAGIGINITNQIALEYNYEQALGDFSNFGNSHEITIAYKFKNEERFNYNDDDDEQALLMPTKRSKRVLASSVPASKKNLVRTKRVPKIVKEEQVKVATLDVEQVEKEQAEDQLIEEQRLKAKEIAAKKKQEDEKLRIAAEEKAKEEAEAARLKAEQAKIAEQLRLKAEAEAIAKQEREAKIKAEQERLAKIEEERIKAEQDRLAKIESDRIKAEAAEKARLAEVARVKKEQEEQARIIAEQEEQTRLAEQEKARIKAELEQQARLAEIARVKAENEERARLAEEARIKAVQEQEARIAAIEAKKKEEEERKRLAIEADEIIPMIDLDGVMVPVPRDNKTREMNGITALTTNSKIEQEDLLNELRQRIAGKQQDLNALKKENDLSEQGIVNTQPKVFKSISAENAALQKVQNDLDNIIQTRSRNIAALETLYRERLKTVSDKTEGVNEFYAKKIQELKLEQDKANQVRAQLITNLERIKVATEVERKRRIKRAAYDNEQARYEKDRNALEIIKETTPKIDTPLTANDFDSGEVLNNIQIVKGVTNTENGYYVVVAVHSSILKRDEFLKKAVASGENNIDFFFDVNTNKYYIYYLKYDQLSTANNALMSKGSKPYNGNMSLIKVEN